MPRQAAEAANVKGLGRNTALSGDYTAIMANPETCGKSSASFPIENITPRKRQIDKRDKTL